MRICSRSLTLLAAQLVSSAWRLGGLEVWGGLGELGGVGGGVNHQQPALLALATDRKEG